MADDGAGDMRQRVRLGGFVDMQVNIQIAFTGQHEQPVEQFVQPLHRAVGPARSAGDAAKNTILCRHQVGQLSAVVPAPCVYWHERHGLQGDSTCERRAHLGKGCPGLGGLSLVAVQMGPDRADAMGLGATEAEGHPGQQIVAAPMSLAVAAGRIARPRMSAAAVGRAAKGMRLV